MKRILCILAIVLSILACTEEIDKSNRYTFIGETVADFMLNRSEKYSHMITLMERAGLFGLLRTYGQYTLFLPDNDAVENFVAEQDSIYHATKDSDNPVWTGVISPFVEELSDSMANVIARMHLIENRNYHTADMGEGALGKWNFNDRALVVSYKVIDERFYIMLNNNSAIIDADNQVENGIVHIIDRPIDPKYRTISNQIAAHPYFNIFSQAIATTGFAERVSQSVDPNYDYTSFITKNDEKYIPKQKYIKFTSFVEPDEVFHANGIYTLDDLKTFAEKWYGTEEKGNYKNPKNALYKFVAYHFVEGEIPYNRVVLSRSGVINGEYFDNYYIPGFDLYNYYPTMQGTLLKALKPLSTTDGLNIYLNYSKRKIPYNFEMRNHTNVRIIELTEFTQMNERYANFVPNAGNGLIHPIDKILIYNEDEMVGNILDERMRFDVASLQPELSSNNIWHNDAIEIPTGYCKGIKTHNRGSSTGMKYRYGGSAYNLDGIQLGALRGLNFDTSILFPPVPPRTYEIRISVRGTPEHLERIQNNEKYQLYFDDKICGNPLLILIVPNNNYDVGWVKDADTYDNGVENDKHMRNLGWMKGPDSWRIASVEGNTVVSRDSEYSLRKIIHRQYLDEGEHWLRFRYIPPTSFVQGGRNYAISLDYIELVPLHIVSDPITPEDRH
jgi:uncharacterized surface protein with fasciclin (FAS1) repeats